MRELLFLQARQECGEDTRRLARVRARSQVLDKRPLDRTFPLELLDHLVQVFVVRPEGLFAKAKVLISRAIPIAKTHRQRAAKSRLCCKERHILSLHFVVEMCSQCRDFGVAPLQRHA